MGSGSTKPVTPSLFTFIHENDKVRKEFDALPWARAWDLDTQRAEVPPKSELWDCVLRRYGPGNTELIPLRMECIRNQHSFEEWIAHVRSEAPAPKMFFPGKDFLEGMRDLEVKYQSNALSRFPKAHRVIHAWRGLPTNRGATELVVDIRKSVTAPFGSGVYLSTEGERSASIAVSGNPNAQGEFVVAGYFVSLKNVYVVTPTADYSSDESGDCDFIGMTTPKPLCSGFDTHYVPCKNYGNTHPRTQQQMEHPVGPQACLPGVAEFKVVIVPAAKRVVPWVLLYFTTPERAKAQQHNLGLHAIRNEPDHGKGYHVLALSLTKATDKVVLGESTITQKELFVEALRHDSHNVTTFLNLAMILQPNEVIVIHEDSGEMDKKMLLVEAIRLAPNFNRGYAALAQALGPDEKIALKSKEVTPKMYSRHDLFLIAISNNVKDPVTYTEFAEILGDEDKVTLLDGRIMTKMDMYVEALRCDHRDANNYCNLADHMKNDDVTKITIFDGQSLTRKQMYVEALKCNPRCVRAYTSLGKIMTPADKVRLPDGRPANKIEVFLEGIRVNPNEGMLYSYLAFTIEQGESVKLHDGRVVGKCGLYTEAARCLPNDVRVLTNLGSHMKSKEVVVYDGTERTKQEVLVEAISKDENFSVAYFALAECTPSPQTVRLHTGRTLSKKALYVEAIRCDPQNSRAFNNLGFSLATNEKIKLTDGRELDKIQLYVEAIRADAKYPTPYLNLGQLIAVDQNVTLPDGKSWSKGELLAKADNLKRH